MASLKQQITTAFNGVGTTLNPTILSQVSALSTSLRLTPTQLAEAWEAHSLTKGIDELNDGSFKGYLSVVSKKQDGVGVKGNNNQTVMSNNQTGLGKRNGPGSNVTPSPAAKLIKTEGGSANSTGIKSEGSTASAGRNGLSAVDSLTTPSGKGAPSPKVKGEPMSAAGGSAAGVSTTVITPMKIETIKYTQRTNSGQTVTSYNPNNLPSTSEVLAIKTLGEKETIQNHRGATIQLHPSSTHPKSTYRHMFTPLEKRATALESQLITMSNNICQKYNISSEEDEMIAAMDGIVKSEVDKISGSEDVDSLWTPVGLPKQSKVVCVGRICNEVRLYFFLIICLVLEMVHVRFGVWYM